jgi:hypothetical protein
MKKSTLRIGRQPDNDIVIDDPSVSSYHAQAAVGPDNTWTLEDHNSSNGTFVDGQRIKKSTITPGTLIVLGRKTFDPARIFRFSKTPDDFTEEFQGIRPVWEKLENERIGIIAQQKKIDVLLAIPYIGRFIILLMSNHYHLEPRKIKLKEDIRRLWVCPSCRQPLRDYDWFTWNDCEHLRSCPKCKARWF